MIDNIMSDIMSMTWEDVTSLFSQADATERAEANAEAAADVSKKYGVESSARQSSAARSAADCVTSDERHEIE
eukprot:SAG31_NODE_17871_length_655_cov_0.946043_1_plen_72_part_01